MLQQIPTKADILLLLSEVGMIRASGCGVGKASIQLRAADSTCYHKLTITNVCFEHGKLYE